MKIQKKGMIFHTSHQCCVRVQVSKSEFEFESLPQNPSPSPSHSLKTRVRVRVITSKPESESESTSPSQKKNRVRVTSIIVKFTLHFGSLKKKIPGVPGPMQHGGGGGIVHPHPSTQGTPLIPSFIIKICIINV